MNRIVIFGNSGSGKSTLASRYSTSLLLEHLDLDTIAWDAPGVRKEIAESIKELNSFIDAHDSWVIEGCYGTLAEEAVKRATEIIFLNPTIEECQMNCRKRPWEPHKYKSKEEQEKNLEMLLDWVADYETREDEFSLQAHSEIFKSFRGTKLELKSNDETRHRVVSTASRNP